MTGPVLTQTYVAPPVCEKEIWRYAGVKGEAASLTPLLTACLEELLPGLSYKVCYREFPVTRQGQRLDLGFMDTASHTVIKALDGCDRVVVFAATVGLQPDRLLARYGAVAPTKALLAQAVGTERIESLCDAFSRDVNARATAEGYLARPRISPGYGDFPLTAQGDLFRVLDCSRQIGLTLNDSLLMSPTKSVTALIGLSRHLCDQPTAGCAGCEKHDCVYRSQA